MKENAMILDVACGGKMFYFDKQDERVLFCDIREVETTHYDNGNCYYEITEVSNCHCECEFCWAISNLLNAGYRKESDVVKEVLEKVMSFTAEDEVGLKYLIRKTAREYGVELSEK